MKFLSMNCWLIPFQANFPRVFDLGIKHRSTRLTKWLRDHSGADGFDVILLQEVWSSGSWLAGLIDYLVDYQIFEGRHLREQLMHIYPFVSNPGGVDWNLIRKQFLDSGLIIASKYPIISQAFVAYSGDVHGVDGFAKKGCLVVALKFPDGSIGIVATTHLYAGPEGFIRLNQVRTALAFIAGFASSIPEKDKIIMRMFAGDFNIPSDSADYSDLAAVMKEEGFSDEGATVPTSDQAPNPPQRIDYVWLARGSNMTGNSASATVTERSATDRDLWAGRRLEILSEDYRNI